MKLGATGDFPQGKLNDDDEGGLRIAISTDQGNVAVYFGTPVSWFALPPDAALDMAEALRHHAMELRKKMT
jgi:hypothetical protein